MAFKFLIFCAALATARAGLLAAPGLATYSAAPAVSSVYSSIAAPAWNTPVLAKTIAAPAVSVAPGPIVAKAGLAAPVWGGVATSGIAAPVWGGVATSSWGGLAAPALTSYGAAPLVTKTLAAPAISTYAAAPAISNVYSSPLLTKTVAPAWGSYAAPALSYAAPHALGSSQQSVVRSLDGNSAVSTYSKAVDTAYSSVRKYDTRVTNDAKLVSPVLSSYAAPALTSYAAPALASYAAPVASYATPVVAKTLAPAAVAYSPASVVSHVSYNSGYGANYGW